MADTTGLSSNRHPLKVLTHLESNSSESGRYPDGWRAGKPVEDPEKTKAWGFVTARPSEYLVYVKGGQIDPRKSGQGARVWKWPWEAVAIVPTTLQKLQFVADQITRERVGVQVTGVAVYRIADPTLAYRVLNFSYAERAGEKLAITLQEMFIGAARRLIANLSLDDCLTRRKEAIASFLMEEIGPVLSGRGSPGDTTQQGWGVVIDTIEIQDVKVLSSEVFSNLQAPFRAELATRAELAEMSRERQMAESRSDTERRVAEASLASERETRALKAKHEAEMAELESQSQLRAAEARLLTRQAEIQREEQLARQKLKTQEELARREAETQAAIRRRKAELEMEEQLKSMEESEQRRKQAAISEAAALQAEASLSEERNRQTLRQLELERQSEQYQLETDAVIDARRAQLDFEVKQQETATQQLKLQQELEMERARTEMQISLAGSQVARDLVNVALPQIAAALGQSVASMNYTHFGGGQAGDGTTPVSMVASAFAQCLTVARGFGLEPEKILNNLTHQSPTTPTSSTTP